MASFSLTEKLAVTGAFLAAVALAIGTEHDPGPVVTGPATVKELRPAAPALVQPPQTALRPEAIEAPAPSPSELPLSDAPVPQPATASQREDGREDEQFDPELGRVPLDFSNGPPST